MKIFALAAAVSMSLAPTLVAAQQQCPANAIVNAAGACICADGFSLSAAGACVPPAPDVVLAVDVARTADLPFFATIPPEAFVIGGLVFLAGAIIGIAAASDDDNAVSTTTTTN